MKILFYFLLFTMIISSYQEAFAQVPIIAAPNKKQPHCSNEMNEKEMLAYKQLVEQEKSYAGTRDGIFNFPIVFHIVRHTNGTGGVTAAEVTQEMDWANEKFAPAGIEFFQCSPPQFIDDDDYFDTEFKDYWDDYCGQSNDEYLIAGENNVPDVINIYYVHTNDGWNWSSFPSYKSDYCKDWIIMDMDGLGADYLLAHELGHYFNLLHTFQGFDNEDGDTREHITRNSNADCYNCNEYGDLLCDTEADPNSWDDCDWDGTGTDGCSNSNFNPDPQNIMSYAHGCQVYFTGGQIARMTYAAAVLRSYLNCPFLSDCESNWNLSGTQTSMYSYQSSDFITSTADINSGVTSAYDAANYITLSVGFYAHNGSDFHAVIEGCWGPEIFKEDEDQEQEQDDHELLPTENSSFLIYPNPGSGLFTMKCDLKTDEPVSVEVFDLLGRKIYEHSETPYATSFTYLLDLNSFPDQTYLVRMNQGGRIEQSTIVKVQF